MTTSDWPADSEWVMVPTDEDLEYERRYWQAMDLDIYTESLAQEQLEDFSTWGTSDLLDELVTLRTLTPDQEDVIAELVAELEDRGVGVAA